MILDLLGRKVVGWIVAERESAVLAQRRIAATISKQGIVAGQPTIHADRGSSMTLKDVALQIAPRTIRPSTGR